MVIARVRGGLEAKAALELQPRVAAEVADVPEGVRLALEEGDDDGATSGEGRGGRAEGALEEGDEELLVVADLAVDVGRFAADVGEVEDDSVVGGAGDGGRELCSVDVVDELVVDGLALLCVGVLVRVVLDGLFFFFFFYVRVTGAVAGARGRSIGVRAAVDHGNVGIHGGVLFYQLGVVLLEDGCRDVCAAVVLDDGGGKAQVGLANK